MENSKRCSRTTRPSTGTFHRQRRSRLQTRLRRWSNCWFQGQVPTSTLECLAHTGKGSLGSWPLWPIPWTHKQNAQNGNFQDPRTLRHGLAYTGAWGPRSCCWRLRRRNAWIPIASLYAPCTTGSELSVGTSSMWRTRGCVVRSLSESGDAWLASQLTDSPKQTHGQRCLRRRFVKKDSGTRRWWHRPRCVWPSIAPTQFETFALSHQHRWLGTHDQRHQSRSHPGRNAKPRRQRTSRFRMVVCTHTTGEGLKCVQHGTKGNVASTSHSPSAWRSPSLALTSATVAWALRRRHAPRGREGKTALLRARQDPAVRVIQTLTNQLTLNPRRRTRKERRGEPTVPSRHQNQRSHLHGSSIQINTQNRRKLGCVCMQRPSRPRPFRSVNPKRGLAGQADSRAVQSTSSNSSKVKSMEAGPIRRASWEIVQEPFISIQVHKEPTTWPTSCQLWDGRFVPWIWNNPIQSISGTAWSRSTSSTTSWTPSMTTFTWELRATPILSS